MKSPDPAESRNLRLVSAVLLATLVVAAAAAWFSYFLVEEREIQGLQQSADMQLEIFRNKLRAQTDKYIFLPELVARHSEIIDTLLHPQDEQRVHHTNLLLQHLNAKVGSDAIYLMDSQGFGVASSRWQEKQSSIGQDYSSRPYFLEAVITGESLFYGIGIASREPAFYSSHIVGRNDAALGVVAVRIDISDLNLGWEANRYEMMVSDRNDVVFLSSREDWKYRPLGGLTLPTPEGRVQSRRYEGVLREPLPVTVTKTLGPDERLIDLTLRDHWYGDEKTAYFVKSRRLADSQWTVHVLTTLDEIEQKAMRGAVTAVGAVALLVMSLMYFTQLRSRARERKAAQDALHEAYQTLEQAHRELERRHSDLKVLTEELRLKSITDPLTGLYNRRFFMSSLAKLVGSRNRYRFPLSVIMLDVDEFKDINDVYGHPAGDKVLQILAALCQEEMREADILARFGGEEFIAALPHADAQAAAIVAERVRTKVMEHRFEVDSGSLHLTVSIGVAQYRPDETSMEQTIKRADEALYLAKNSGRNRLMISE